MVLLTEHGDGHNLPIARLFHVLCAVHTQISLDFYHAARKYLIIMLSRERRGAGSLLPSRNIYRTGS